SYRVRPSLPGKLQQAAIAAANFQQTEARPCATYLVKQAIELPLDAFFQCAIRRQELAVGQVANSDRFGGMHERVTKLDPRDRRHTLRWLTEGLKICSFRRRMLGDSTQFALDERHGILLRMFPSERSYSRYCGDPHRRLPTKNRSGPQSALKNTLTSAACGLGEQPQSDVHVNEDAENIDQARHKGVAHHGRI